MTLRNAARLAAATSCALLLAPVARAADLTWTARIDGAAAFDAPHLQKLEFTLQPTVDSRLGDRWRFRTIARLRFDAAGELGMAGANPRARAAGSRPWRFASGRGELELREFFVDGSLGDIQLRLGKQQVVWGQADGLRVLDVVNPVSWREFMLSSPEERRIPLWTLNAELPVARGSLQLLWVADPTFDEVPQRRHPFTITTPLLVPRASADAGRPPPDIEVLSPERPGGLWAASDFGARWSGQVGRWDVTLNGLYHHWDVPAPFRRVDGAVVRIEPRYERSTLLGASYATAFGSFAVRGEVGYSTRRLFPSTDSGDIDGVFAARELAHVVGVDHTGMRNTLLSVQLFQSWISARPAGATRRRLENQATLLIQHEALNQSLRIRALWLRNLDRGDRALQAQLAWKWRSDAVVTLGLETFDGTRAGLFGQFQDASRATLAVELGF